MKNLRLAIRSLLHFRLYTVINILGLALALACVIVIFRYVHGETTVNHFHEKADRIYACAVEYVTVLTPDMFKDIDTNNPPKDPDSPIRFYGPGEEVPEWTPDPKRSDGILTDPGVELRSQFLGIVNTEVTTSERTVSAITLMTDSNFLRIMDFPVLAGPQWLERPDEVYLTPSFAEKVFGKEDPIGRTFRHSTGKTLTVVGIIENYPSRNGIRFDLVANYTLDKSLSSGNNHHLVLLHPNQDYRQINKRWDPQENTELSPNTRWKLIPLKEVYLSQEKDLAGFRRGNKQTVVILLIVGFLILSIGIVNFINVYTAVVLRRGREFGMKKVFGASARQVFGQLLTENTIMIAFALFIALALTEISNPVVKNILGFDQLPFVAFDFYLALALFVFIPPLTTLVPFLRYNYATPVESLRSVGKTGGKSAVRRVLLVAQYTITIVMIVVSLFFLKQLNSMLNIPPGFRTQDIIQSSFTKQDFHTGLQGEELRKEIEDRRERNQVIKQRMDASPLFSAWTYGRGPIKSSAATNEMEFEGELYKVSTLPTNEKWMDIFGIEPIEGDSWDDETNDQSDDLFLFSESAIRSFGISDYRTAVIDPKQVFWISVIRGKVYTNGDAFRIIGIVPDLHIQHIGKENHPLIFRYSSFGDNYPILAVVVPGKRQEAIEFLRQLHDETVGGEFTYSFIEDDVKALYEEDRKVATIYSIFTVIAILISALGLFSMSLFDVQQRYKEIAIRKVNGATTSVIIGLLLRKYLVLLGISFVIAVPVAWYAIQRYLEDFAYKTAVSWWLFAAALLITAGISLLTLIHQTRRAAAANPADVIRNE